jgi:hypothetical protein
MWFSGFISWCFFKWKMPYTRGIIVICHILQESLITLFKFPYYIPLSNIKKPNVTHTKDFCETKLPKLLNFEKKNGLKLPYLDNRF